MRFSCHSINALVSGNAGDEKNLHPGDCKKKKIINLIFQRKFTLKKLL